MKILILCTGNSCRSQMAEGWLKSFDSRLQVFSAGTRPAGAVHPLAIRVMEEMDIDLSKSLPRRVDRYLEEYFDYVVTVCDHANETCPVFLGTVRHRLHIGFDDPAQATGDDEHIVSEFRRVRDEIHDKFLELYNQQIRKEFDMAKKSWGFIGAGRVTRILLEGFKRTNRLAENILITDINEDVASSLQKEYPFIKLTKEGADVARQDYVFLALHPPALAAGLEAVKNHLAKDAIVISLAPKFTLEKMSAGLAGFNRIARWLPNAATFIGKGHNPFICSPTIPSLEQAELTSLFSSVGECVKVAEEKIEAYAVVVAMGPTYFWFQWQQLLELGKSFGLSEQELKTGLSAMLNGASELLFHSGLAPEQVIDLIPVKPLSEDETTIKAAFLAKLPALHQKLKA